MGGGAGFLWKWLLEFRESRNIIRKLSYFREISSNFVYFRITLYTTFRIIWHDFQTKFRIPSYKNLTNNKYLWNLGLYWVLKLFKNKRNWISNWDPKSIFSNGIRNKKKHSKYTKFRVYEMSQTTYSAQTTFSTHSRETSRRWLGVGEVRQYTPQPLPLHCCHRISQNTAEFCIDLHRQISYNFAKFGPFSNGFWNKKNIQNIRNFEYTKCRKHGGGWV